MTSWFSKFSVPFVALLITTLGCSSSDKPDLAEVTGTLTKDGKPFADALVEFYPQGSGGASYGTTDAEGKFKLSYTTGDPGAAAGTHLVKVVGGRVVGGSGAASEKIAATEDGEEFAIVGSPDAPANRSSGPPPPVELTAEVVANQANVIALEMP